MQGLEGLGLAVLGGELQHIGHVSLLVGLHVAGDDHAVAVSQAVACQVVALVLGADFVQVQVGDLGTGGVVHGVLGSGGLSSLAGSSLRACSLAGCGSRRCHRGGSSGGRRAAAGGHADSQCQSGSSDCNILEFHMRCTPFFRVSMDQPVGPIGLEMIIRKL